MIGYRPEIDGMRAVAVVPVLIYHAGFTWPESPRLLLPGGFVGVDVFFVISGYLITTMLIADLSAGRFSLWDFYERRARRILPALFLVMLCCVPFALLWMLPRELDDFGKSLFATTVFASNILEWQIQDYFAPDADLKPLLHTWSLAVEEQFYLLFPLGLCGAWHFGKRKAMVIIGLVAVLSFLLSLWGDDHARSAQYYLLPFRMWELLAGSLCAFWLAGRTPPAGSVLGLIGLALVLVPMGVLQGQQSFGLLLPVAGTMLIILFASGKNPVARCLSLAPLVQIGLMSYSLYLWHNPLFAFARLRLMGHPSHGIMLGLIAFTFVLGWLSWRYVEQPFRQQRDRLLPKRTHLFAVAGAVALLLIVPGLLLNRTRGLPQRVPSDAALIVREVGMANGGLALGCLSGFDTTANCATSDTPEVLVWGDSFAAQLVPGLLASQPDLAMQQRTLALCAPLLNIAAVRKPEADPKASAEECLAFNDRVLEWLATKPQVKTVILSTTLASLSVDTWTRDSQPVPLADRSRRTEAEFMLVVQRIRGMGKKVVLFGPAPYQPDDPGLCVGRALWMRGDPRSCNFTIHSSNYGPGSRGDVVDRLARQVPTIRLDQMVCPQGPCLAFRDGVAVYTDTAHLSARGSTLLGRRYDWMRLVREATAQ